MHLASFSFLNFPDLFSTPKKFAHRGSHQHHHGDLFLALWKGAWRNPLEFNGGFNGKAR